MNIEALMPVHCLLFVFFVFFLIQSSLPLLGLWFLKFTIKWEREVSDFQNFEICVFNSKPYVWSGLSVFEIYMAEFFQYELFCMVLVWLKTMFMKFVQIIACRFNFTLSFLCIVLVMCILCYSILILKPIWLWAFGWFLCL